MELLESERRILSPGCCTEEREKEIGKKGGGEVGKEGGRELRTMHHALLLREMERVRRQESGREGHACTRERVERRKKEMWMETAQGNNEIPTNKIPAMKPGG